MRAICMIKTLYFIDALTPPSNNSLVSEFAASRSKEIYPAKY